MKVVRLSAIRTGRFYTPGNIPDTHSCLRLSRSQGHSAAGRIMSMKNSSDTIGNRTRDLLVCSAVHIKLYIFWIQNIYPFIHISRLRVNITSKAALNCGSRVWILNKICTKRLEAENVRFLTQLLDRPVYSPSYYTIKLRGDNINC